MTNSRAPGDGRLLIVNAYLCALTLVAPALFTRDVPFLAMAAILLVRGFIRSLQLNALNAITYAEAPPDRMSGASSLAATMQQTAQGLSIAVASSAVASIVALMSATSHQAIGATFVFLAAVSLISLFYFRALPDDAGADLSGRLAKAENTAD